MSVCLKKASFSHIEFLWFLRNRPETYQYFKAPKPVMLNTHVQWIMPTLIGISQMHLYVIYWEYTPVGQIRFDYHNSEGEVSISLLKEFWGKGIASKALTLGIRNLKREKKIHTLKAEIHGKNQASKVLFENLGFVYQRKVTNFLIYSLSL